MELLESLELTAVILRVRDVAASVAWWRDRLGIEPLFVGSDGAEHPVAAFSFGGLTASLWQLPPGETRDPAGNDTNSYLVCTVRDDPALVRETLVGRGIDVGPLQRSKHFDFFWFHDPDGNRFEVSRIRAGRTWEGTA